jgi:hypothetical protein
VEAGSESKAQGGSRQKGAHTPLDAEVRAEFVEK